MKIFPVGAGGLTRAGVILMAAIIGVVAIAAVPVFKLTEERFSSSDTEAAMKDEGRRAIDHIADELARSKRLFADTPGDVAFLARTGLVSAPRAMPGSLLPAPEEPTVVSAGSATFVNARVGNQLFFAVARAPVPLEGGAQIDTYVFVAYYLALDDTKLIGGVARRELWEWRSAVYADETQLAVKDTGARADAVAQLLAAHITRAWNPTAANVEHAFFDIAGTALTPAPGHVIAEESARRMIRITAGMSSGGYREGVSPNTGSKFKPPHVVPKFATAAGDFPSGFEVVVAGPRSARQVFMRLVLAAQGRFSGSISSEQVTLVTIRDLW